MFGSVQVLVQIVVVNLVLIPSLLRAHRVLEKDVIEDGIDVLVRLGLRVDVGGDLGPQGVVAIVDDRRLELLTDETHRPELRRRRVAHRVQGVCTWGSRRSV